MPSVPTTVNVVSINQRTYRETNLVFLYPNLWTTIPNRRNSPCFQWNGIFGAKVLHNTYVAQHVTPAKSQEF